METPGKQSERPAYLDTPAGQIYCVMHAAAGQRRGAILICGPFAAERERAYLTLANWARVLAAKGIEALRFDYRGIGESSGRFEELTITDWREDAALCASRLAQSCPGVPLILQGVRLGALIASELFAAGVGDGLLLWSPPASARDLLWNTMRQDLVAKMKSHPKKPHGTREEQAAAIEAGESVNVDGYFWSRALWNDMRNHTLCLPPPDEQRPWHVIDLARVAGSARGGTAKGDRRELVIADRFWEATALLLPRCDELYRASLEWLERPGLAGGRRSA